MVGSYPTRTDAFERGLVVAAMELEHWIEREDDRLLLCVLPQHAGEVMRELAKYDRERITAPIREAPKHSARSSAVAGAVMLVFLFIQFSQPNDGWENAGVSASERVMAGEWWRVFTALTLHADLSHFGANLAAGLVFSTFLLPLLGAGWTWLLVVLAGGAGNWLNAWGHRGEMHHSIGASTAVFGALGLLVGAQFAARLLSLRKVAAREVWLPLGAGLALLAFLGVGDAQTDYTAHFFGMLAGFPLGALAVALEFRRRTPVAVQWALGLAAPGLLAVAWAVALAKS